MIQSQSKEKISRIWTIGHSTRNIDIFISLLEENGIKRLLEVTHKAGPVAIMCAEAVWWRCHRSLIADYLKSHGVEVVHILDANKIEPHPFTSAARIVNGKLSYESDSLL